MTNDKLDPLASHVFTTYITTNSYNGTLYTGHTDCRVTRMVQHVSGTFEGFAKRHGCIHLVWYEDHPDRHTAFTRERRIKNWHRQWKLNLIKDFNPLWLDLNTVPHWPLPDETVYPDLHARCLSHSPRTEPAPS